MMATTGASTSSLSSQRTVVTRARNDQEEQEGAARSYRPHEICEAAVDYVLQNVNTVQYMIQSIEEVTGMAFTRDRIKCLPLTPRMSSIHGENATGGLTPDHVHAGYMWRRARSDCQAKDVVLLEDHVLRLFDSVRAQSFMKNEKAAETSAKSSSSTAENKAAAPSLAFESSKLERLLVDTQQPMLQQMERNIRHELVHAFDDARGYIDSSDCQHQACSEIRAARLSGDCFAGQEMRKGRFNFFEGGQKCVRRRAIMAVERNPVCRGFSERAVEMVFQRCYSDYEPFTAPIYALGSYGEDRFPNSSMKL